MAKTLRGGKWDTVSRSVRTDSRSNSAHSRSISDNPTALLIDNDDGDVPTEDPGSIISFFEERKDLGVACYDFAVNEIHLSRVTPDEDYTVVAQVIDQIDANAVVLPTSYSGKERILKSIRCKDTVVDRGSDDMNVQSSSKETHSANPSKHRDLPDLSRETMISFIPNSEFAIAKSRELCSIVQIESLPKSFNPTRAPPSYMMHVAGEEDCVVRAIGGLLSFLLKNGVLGTVATGVDGNETIQINTIVYRNFFNTMRLGPTTLRALNVFNNDKHPIGHGSLKGKEGVSLFGILKTHVRTAAARDLLKNWLRYPSTCIETIRERQFVVDLLRKSSNRVVLVAVKDALRGVKNVPAILRRMRKISAKVTDWKALYSSLKSFIILMDTMKVAIHQNVDFNESSILARFTKIDERQLRDAENWIDAVVDFEESSVSGRMVVAEGFSEEIDEMKRSYNALDDFLTAVGVEEHERLSQVDNAPRLNSLYFTYNPQIGYLVVLTENDCDQIGIECLEMHGMSFVFRSSEHEYHFKTERCRQLDDELGDIHGAIVDLEAKAFRYLENCLQALACSATEYTWTKPDFCADDDRLMIESGRHPLLDLLVPSFVPNSTNLRRGDVQVLTGPNYSGKSAYLSQVALIIILAQIGSCVPAKSASLTLLDNIFSQVSNFESVSYGQSSFFMDASEVARMLRNSPGKSLNLIDEFGKGTLEADGMALFAATIRYMLRASTDCVTFTICATHFAEVLSEPILPLSNPRLLLFSMEVMTCTESYRTLGERFPNAADNEAECSRARADPVERPLVNRRGGNERRGIDDPLSSCVRTYRLLPGSVCQESRALQCALEGGVPKVILQHAAHVSAAIFGCSVIENAVEAASNNERIQVLHDIVLDFLSTDFETN